MPSISFKGTFGNFRKFDRATEDFTQESFDVANDIKDQILEKIDEIPVSDHPLSKGTLKEFLSSLVDVKIVNGGKQDIYRVGLFTEDRTSLAIALNHEFGGTIRVTEDMRKFMFAQADDDENMAGLKATTQFLFIEEKRFIRDVFLGQSNARQLINRFMFALRRN